MVLFFVQGSRCEPVHRGRDRRLPELHRITRGCLQRCSQLNGFGKIEVLLREQFFYNVSVAQPTHQPVTKTVIQVRPKVAMTGKSTKLCNVCSNGLPWTLVALMKAVPLGNNEGFWVRNGPKEHPSTPCMSCPWGWQGQQDFARSCRPFPQWR